MPKRSEPRLELPEAFRIASLGELDQTTEFADLRIVWNPAGLGFSIHVGGKSRKPQCDPATAASSDGLHVWLDTRHTQTVHRATKFCHQFALLPTGGGPRKTAPHAAAIPLARARDEAALADAAEIQIWSEIRSDGYLLEAWLPKSVLVGFDPDSHPRLGFHYVVRDRELGDQSLAAGSEFPYASDPSLWQTLELADT